MGHLFVLNWARVRRVARGECCFGVMYCEWYGFCDFVVLSVVEVCADYVGGNVFHVCLNFGVVNVCGVVCVVCLFLTSSIFRLMLMGSVMLSICISSCVLYSAVSGVKRVHVVLSGLRMRLFVCVHVCISCRYDWMFAFAMLMSLCVDVMVMSSV